ncbi:MAG: sigma-70 family RNA polymerase sigma factor [Bryobacterales bacterium]|jgi:RNA polymerase sigma-70 factor (ECF subfamily)|nr:sigma-70 family RNA polymerase sigma factor [Bryobacterales bacterium]
MAAEADSQLMLQVKEGDETSFALLLHRFRAPICQFLYRMVHNQAVAEELAQEVFLRVYRARDTYQPDAKFSTWVYRIATHLALNHIRDHKNERHHLRPDDDAGDGPRMELRDAAASVEERLVASSRAQQIQDAVSSLPEKQRLAVTLHKYQELDYRQIAELLGTSESAVKSLLFRAYETLRGSLAHLAPASATKAGK